MIYWFSHFVMLAISKIFFPISVKGIKYFPSHSGCIIASNHLSNLDPMILGLASSRQLTYVAKKSLFKNKFFSFILKQVGAFPIRRNSSDTSAIKEALKRLRTGGRLVIFPEGTRKALNKTKRIQPGIALLAVKAGVPVIPAFISGSDKVMPPGSKGLRREPVIVKFGRPHKYSSSQSYQEIARRIMLQIESLSDASKK